MNDITKIILVVEPDVTELEAQLDMLRRRPENLNILPARNYRQGCALIEAYQVDAILAAAEFSGEARWATIERFTTSFPYIPVAAATPAPADEEVRAAAAGASLCLEKPIEDPRRLDRLLELAEAAHIGTVRGVPLHSLLQMHENDGQNCTLQVFSDRRSGFIYLENGVVINAESDGLTGEAAFLEMIAWEEVITDIRFFNGKRERAIATPLMALIMEGFRRKDERRPGGRAASPPVKPKQRLKQYPTRGLRLALNIGQQLTVEFESLGLSLESTLIGMVPERCLIISTPTHFSLTAETPEPDSVILVKFNHMDQLYLFRAAILNAIETPEPLLLIQYPSVVHYHNVRRDPRAALSLPCDLKTGNGAVFDATIRDISQSGVAIAVARADNDFLPTIAIQQRITLGCTLPGIGRRMEFEAVVKTVKSDRQLVEIGSEFTRHYTELDRSIELCLQPRS